MDEYDDETQDLHINFKKGETVLLNGKMAEEYFRLGSINFFTYDAAKHTYGEPKLKSMFKRMKLSQ